MQQQAWSGGEGLMQQSLELAAAESASLIRLKALHGQVAFPIATERTAAIAFEGNEHAQKNIDEASRDGIDPTIAPGATPKRELCAVLMVRQGFHDGLGKNSGCVR
jgi:hypothetical protein